MADTQTVQFKDPATGAQAPGQTVPPALSTDIGETAGRVVIRPEEKTAEKPAGERPAWLPEGIDSPEALRAAYDELKNGKKPAETPKAPETREAAEAQLAQVGLQMKDFAAEFQKDGKLSDASYAKLAEKGVTREVADGFIKAQSDRVSAYEAGLEKAAGGPEALKELFRWAGSKLSAEEQAAANSVIQSMNAGQAALLIRGLQAQRAAEVGIEPELLTGRARPAGTGPKPFGSNAEMTAAMRDPRYATDSAYRKGVEARIAAGM